MAHPYGHSPWEYRAYEDGKNDERKQVIEFLKEESSRIRTAAGSLLKIDEGKHNTGVLALDAMGVALLEVAVQIERGNHRA